MKPIHPFSNITATLLRRYTLVLCASFFVMLNLGSCQSKSKTDRINLKAKAPNTGKTSSITNSVLEKYQLARENYSKNPNDPEAIIWFGRRAAYLGNYKEAIEIFTRGIKRHPQDARMYRHRGHRYISIRQFNKAIEDLEMAAALIENKEDQIEPAGLPNGKNIPLSTLHGNIWYHLGLAYYLKNDMDKSLKAFSNRTVTKRYDDNLVSSAYWRYMILLRVGNTEDAKAVISEIKADMNIIENFSYHKMCLFYKNILTESELRFSDLKSASDNVFSYGLGHWYLYKNKDTLKAKTYYRQLLDKGTP